MASLDLGTSSGSEYQVFLSFRGPDTRVGFTDFLFHSLTDAGIRVFRDDEELRIGERIDGSLLRAIDNSKIYIPVFSRTYASSQWCLRELVQMVANTKSEGNKEILPIFVDVDPDDVKLKTQLYSDAILTLEREKELNNEQVHAWREALKEVDAIKGWEVKKYGGYGELIKLVVEEVVKKLKTKHRMVTEHLVGIKGQVAQVHKLLDINSDGVRIIKIYGMGGIGKTTLAKVIFNRLSSRFGKWCCFLEDVRGKSSKANGLVDLQKKLLSEIGHLEAIRSIDEIEYGMKRIGEILCNKKVLIVLDDIDNDKQVEQLIGKSALYSGSRILITTRNKNVLQTNRIKYHILDYEMQLMSPDHALELFNRHAFDRGSRLDDYNDLSRAIVSSTGRLPLALEVIGSYLYHKLQELWEETLDKLRKAPDNCVFEKLKISYDALTFEQKQIFLDIACFFVGEDKTNAFYMWEDCTYFPKIEVDFLISMSLVKIVESNKFWMHNQLRDLGREIVCSENKLNPKKRSRIWIQEEVLDAIKTKQISENVQALYLDESICSSHDVVVQSEEIGRFEHLRFLKLSQLSLVGDIDLTKLRWISLVEIYKWTDIRLEKVVVLELSKVEFLDDLRLQNLIKMTRKLKVLSLQDCHSITRTPDFFECPNLERLTFQRCSKLTNIDGSIGKLNKLIDLKIQSCHSLKHLPEDIGDLVNLQCFFVKATKVNKLPDSIWKLHEVVHLLDESNGICYWLNDLIGLSGIQNVLEIQNSNLKGLLRPGVRGLHFMRILNPSYTPVREIPKTSSMRPPLQRIELMQCHDIQELPTFPTSLTHLSVYSSLLWVVPDLSNLTNLVQLNLIQHGERVEPCTGQLGWIGRLSKLTTLHIRLRQVPTPTELGSLPQLNKLKLIECDVQTFEDLKNSVTSPSQDLRNLSSLMLRGSPMQELQLDGLQLPQLKKLHVQGRELLRLRLSRMSELKNVRVDFSPKLVEIQLSWVFESLEKLFISYCNSLERLVYETDDVLSSPEGRLIFPSRVLNKLRYLRLEECYKILDIQVVGTSESWQTILLWGNNLQSLGGLSNLKNLKRLDIQNCNSLRVVEGVDELESLGHLWLHNCALLERLIDVSTTKLPNDCDLYITGCEKLRGLVNEFRASIGTSKHSKRRCDQYTRKITKKRKRNVDLVNDGSNSGRSLKRSRQVTQPRNRKGKGQRKERRKGRRRVLLARATGIRLSRINFAK